MRNKLFFLALFLLIGTRAFAAEGLVDLFSGEDYAMTVSGMYGYPREGYGTIGFIFGGMENDYEGLLIESTIGGRDFGGSIGYAQKVKDEIEGGAGIKLTFLRGTKDSVNKEIEKNDSALGVEGNLSLGFAGVNAGLFYNVSGKSWFPEVSVGLKF